MMKRSLFLVLFLIGCGGRVSLGDHGSGNDPLSGSDDQTDAGTNQTGADAAGLVIADAGRGDSGLAVEDSTAPASEIAYIEDDETTAAVPRKIRVYANCRVTDHTGLDAFGEAARCKELFDIALDPTTFGCGPNGDSVGFLRVHLKDGRVFVRDLSADRCSVVIPSIRAHKFTWAVWYSAGGG